MFSSVDFRGTAGFIMPKTTSSFSSSKFRWSLSSKESQGQFKKVRNVLKYMFFTRMS